MNRIAVFALMAAFTALLGATCDGPLIDLDANTPSDEVKPGPQLGAAVIMPAVDREVPVGTLIEVEWTLGNLTGDSAIATVLVRKIDELAETILSGGILVDGSGTTQSVFWDTTDFPVGEYVAIVRVTVGDRDIDARSTGNITLNAAPELDFIEPRQDVTLEAGEPADPNGPDPTRTTITWRGFDADGDGMAMVGVDPDLNHDNGNEIILDESTLTPNADLDRFVWDGTENDTRVDAGFYNVFAILTDAVNERVVVEGLGRIRVLPEPNTPDAIELAITEPAEDTEFLTRNDPLKIEYTLDEEDDVLVDIKVDTDDDHQNGNETTILSQRLVESGTTAGEFDWNGQDVDGMSVGNGIFRVFLALSRESGMPQVVEAPGLVFRRNIENLPLIELLNPLGDRTVEGGDFVMISWRDDDPQSEAEIRITIDDDDMPNQVVETDDAEIEVLVNRSASGDGVQDTFQYQVPASLPPGRYSVFAYIDRDGTAPFDQIGIAAGKIVIEDPNQNN